MPNGVDVGFLKGAQLEDKYGLLQGSGKKVRVLCLTQYSEQKTLILRLSGKENQLLTTTPEEHCQAKLNIFAGLGAQSAIS